MNFATNNSLELKQAKTRRQNLLRNLHGVTTLNMKTSAKWIQAFLSLSPLCERDFRCSWIMAIVVLLYREKLCKKYNMIISKTRRNIIDLSSGLQMKPHLFPHISLSYTFLLSPPFQLRTGFSFDSLDLSLIFEVNIGKI